MIGEKFHKLTVVSKVGLIENTKGRRRTYWMCECECGNVVDVLQDKLGRTKSCGCIRHNKPFSARDLSGQIFGRLTVEGECGFVRVGVAQKRRKKVRCRCTCGKVVEITELGLLSGNTSSCGCLRVDTMKKLKFVDLTGRSFGRVVVMKFIGSKNRNNIWECVCNCGSVFNARASNLYSGNTESCGCLKQERITKHGLSGDLKLYTALLRSDPIRRIKHRVSCSVRKAMSGQKQGSVWNYLDYTPLQLKMHLESHWEPWMNWSNYGGLANCKKKTWWIDHTKPHSSFVYSNMEDSSFTECWSLSNLRPMEKIANISKGNKV